MTGEEERSETLTLGKRKPSEVNEEDAGELEEEGEEDEEEAEIEELEREVKEMAEKVLDSRRKVPVQIMEALSSHLAARRPAAAAAGATGDPRSDMQDNSEPNEDVPPTEADQAVLDKLQMFKAKTASNIAAMPVILKRMNECIAKLDKLEQYNVNIHSVFKRRK